MITIVPATPSLIREYYGDVALPTMRAWVWLEDNVPVAVAGFIRLNHNSQIIFSESKNDIAKRHKVLVMKFGRFLLRIADEHHWTLLADPDKDILTAKQFLERLGFEPGENGEYIRWAH